jgi:hypothetical protein
MASFGFKYLALKSMHFYLFLSTSTCFIYALHVRLGISLDGFGFKLQMSDLEIILAPV